MKKSEISLAIMVLKYGLDYLQYLWDPLIAFFMAEFPSQAHFLGLTHVSGQKRAPGHGTPFCALVRLHHALCISTLHHGPNIRTNQLQ